MVTEGELRRLAGAWRTDVTVVERDYVLSWVLAGLYRRAALAERLIFKGGTALRKCYFPDYRFSADLDFTLHSLARPRTALRDRDRLLDCHTRIRAWARDGRLSHLARCAW